MISSLDLPCSLPTPELLAKARQVGDIWPDTMARRTLLRRAKSLVLHVVMECYINQYIYNINGLFMFIQSLTPRFDAEKKTRRS